MSRTQPDKVFNNPLVRMALTIVASYYTFGYVGMLTSNGFLGAAAGGFVGGLISTGTLKGAAIGALTGAAFYGVGNYFKYAAKLKGAASWNDGQLWFGKIVAHGTVGGASSAAQGGSFQDGFRSAGFTQFAAPVVGSVPGDTIGRTAAAAVVGGTASKLGGGKFANGAATGAFSRLFNDAHDGGEYRHDKISKLGSRMEPLGVVNESRQGFWGKAVGLFVDITSAIKGGVSFERGRISFEKVDTIVTERRWYQRGTDRLLRTEEVGGRRDVIDVNGTQVPGYNYVGGGVYTRDALIINGFPANLGP